MKEIHCPMCNDEMILYFFPATQIQIKDNEVIIPEGQVRCRTCEHISLVQLKYNITDITWLWE